MVKSAPAERIQWSMMGTIFALAWPTMLEQLMQTAVQYIDTAMVGALGTQATAAVGSTTTINWLLISSISALGIGFLSFIARSFGAGDPEKARRAVAQSVLVTLICGTFFTVLTVAVSPVIPRWMQVDPDLQEMASRYFLILYLPMLPRSAGVIFGTVLRAAGDSKTPMRVGFLINIINIIGNCLLIFPTRAVQFWGLQLTLPGAGWGITGAAAASAIAYTIGGICITVAL